jgi:gentisate 1,2-dioxygenase
MQIEPAIIDQLRHFGSLEALKAALDARNMTPGWIKRPTPIFREQMRSEFVTAHWRYEEAKAAMQSAARLIGTDIAERRNFIMRNPTPDNDIATLRTLICAYQSILPGEKARSHRHSAHAMRVILESRGSYSIVNGDKHPMESGDIVLTPGWYWHGHGHEGSEQAYWFDCLDIPLTRLLEPVFYEDHPEGWEPVRTVSTSSPMRFPRAEILFALEDAPADPAGHFGKMIEIPAPEMPTITIKVHGWPAGWHNRPYRHSVNTLYVVMQGRGRSIIDEATFDWSFGDTLAIPAWNRIEHHAEADSVLVALSDENLMRWTRFYRLEPLD